MKEYVDLYEDYPSAVIPSHTTAPVSLGIVVERRESGPYLARTEVEKKYVLPTSSRSSDNYPLYVDGLKYYIGRSGDAGFDPDSKFREKYLSRLPEEEHPLVELWAEVLRSEAEAISEMFDGVSYKETILPIVEGEPLAQPAGAEKPTPLQRVLQSRFQQIDAREKKGYGGEKRQCMLCKEQKTPGRLVPSTVGGIKWTTHNAPYTRTGANTDDEYPLAICAECAEKVSAGYNIAAGRTRAGGDETDVWFTRRLGGTEPLWLMVFNGDDSREEQSWITRHADDPTRLRQAIKNAAAGRELGLPSSPLRVRLFGKQETQMLVYVDEVVHPETLFDNVTQFARQVEEGTTLGDIADATYRVKSENEDLKKAARSDLIRALLLGEAFPDRWIRMWHQHRLRRSRRGEAGDYWAGTNPKSSERSLCALITDGIDMKDTTAYKLGQFLAGADAAYHNETGKSFYASSRHWREMVEAPADAISNLGEKLVRQEAGTALDHLAEIDIDEVPGELTPQQQAAMTLGFAAERQAIFAGVSNSDEDED